MSYIPTALKLQEAAKEGVADSEVSVRARFLIDNFDTMPPEAFKEFLMDFGLHLAATVTQSVTQVFMTEDQISEMLNEITEFQDVANNIDNE
jgi:hypothetical protein